TAPWYLRAQKLTKELRESGFGFRHRRNRVLPTLFVQNDQAPIVDAAGRGRREVLPLDPGRVRPGRDWVGHEVEAVASVRRSLAELPIDRIGIVGDRLNNAVDREPNLHDRPYVREKP